MAEETLKNNGTAELSNEELEQVDGGVCNVMVHVREQELKERKEQEQHEREIVKGRPTAALKQ